MPEHGCQAFPGAVLARGTCAVRALLMLPHHANSLPFRKPGSLHPSVLQKAGLLLRVEKIRSGRSR